MEEFILQKLRLLEVSTNVAAWTKLRSFKCTILACWCLCKFCQPARIDVTVALLLGYGRNAKPPEHYIYIFGTQSLNDRNPNFIFINCVQSQSLKLVRYFSSCFMGKDGRTY